MLLPLRRKGTGNFVAYRTIKTAAARLERLLFLVVQGTANLIAPGGQKRGVFCNE